MHPKDLSIADFTYNLPAERIALHPLAKRDHSKLLVWDRNTTTEDHFFNLGKYIFKEGLLLFNNTKVMPARLLFTRPTGGTIEIFCLEPFADDHASAMQRTSASRWKCMIGGASKWKSDALTRDVLYEGLNITLTAQLIEKKSDAYIVAFTWNVPDLSFSQLLQAAGEIPLPPYIKRKVATDDTERYQTIYAKDEGSVAAPTAGLHFTDELISVIRKRNTSIEFITLHVGAGTFKPVKSGNMAGHSMHAEFMDVSLEAIQCIIDHIGTITAVGTTTLRVIESLFWMGVKCDRDPQIQAEKLIIGQWEIYEDPLINCNTDPKFALLCLAGWMKNNNLNNLVISTSILIAPGYTFRIIRALVTNFHQPGSTLLLLVAAITGNDWRQIYKYALENDFRFLSYGDGCLLTIS